MNHSVSGLDADQVGLVVHALSQSGNKDLASLYITTLTLVDTAMLLLLREMFSTRRHIVYWSQLAKSPKWEIYLYSLNSKIFKALFSRKDRNYLILDNSELMLRHAEMLKADLCDLSILLERISEAGANLKAIYLNLDSMSGTVSDKRRRTLSLQANRKSDLELTDSTEIGVKLGVAMTTTVDDDGSVSGPGLGLGLGERHAAVFGLSVPSEEEEWVIKEGGVDILQAQHQQMRFQSKEDEKAEELAMVRELTRRQLEKCLVSLSESFAEFVPHLVLSFPVNATSGSSKDAEPASTKPVEATNESAAESTDLMTSVSNAQRAAALLNPSLRKSELSLPELEELYANLDAFLDSLREARGCKAFPLQFTQARVHKPSDRERLWFRNVLLLVVGALSVKTVVGLWRDGSILNAYHFVQAKVADHIVDPMNKLGRELFDTIRKREYVVTREECEESRESLHRMLHDFSKSAKGSTLIGDMKDRIKETIIEKQHAAAAVAGRITGSGGGGASSTSGTGTGGRVGGGNSSSTGAASAGVGTGGSGGAAGSAGTGSGVRASDLRAAALDDFTPEQAMAALMTAYEKELQSPVQGMVFGNLMTAILIQMQKLKVHTEAAMLTMDQILASNELTIAATAAMPAFAFMGMSLFWLKKWFQPRASNPGAATMHLRLIMSDVERSLQEVQQLSSAFSFSTSSAAIGAAGAHGVHVVHGRTLPHTFSAATMGISRNNSDFLGHSGHSVAGAAAPPTPSLQRGRSLSVSSTDARDPSGQDARVRRFQQGLLFRRLQIARGALQFNLVRLRSEFHSVFGTNKDAASDVGRVNSAKSRGLTLNRRGLLSSLGAGLQSTYLHNPHVTSTMRKWRMRRSSSAVTAMALSSAEAAGPTSPVRPGKEATANALDGDAADQDLDEARMEVVSQMLTIMQKGESGIGDSVFSTATGVFKTLYTMIFGSVEEISATTQYGSLRRDIALLEAPEFEVSLERKITTATRMRVSYNCLIPTK